ncbi:MAG: clan AA aspartic protease [Ignavibacteriae bacterium]|nr:clan AA aspartic protease [Ignavibacteriota bacterium]
MKQYILEHAGNLFSLKAALYGGDKQRLVTLILDTGASRTLVSRVRLELLGYSVAQSKSSQRIITASGIVHAQVIMLDNFYCLGKNIQHFEVVAYDLPPESHVEGLLGMDFLSKFDFHLSTQRGIITIK